MSQSNEIKITKENFDALQAKATELGKAYVDALAEQIIRQGFSISNEVVGA